MTSLAGPGSADPLVGGLRRSGLVTLLVLHFVSGEACYGNQLMDRILALTGGAVSVNPNTMYPLLRSLERRGLVTGGWERSDRRGRRLYRITPAGQEERRTLARRLEPNLRAIQTTVELIREELRGS
jgi:DNA-binding PadR family transcriptional regulator